MLLSRINIPAHVRFLFLVYLKGLFCFTLLRVILLLGNIYSEPLSGTDYGKIFISFFYGFRFDTCISCYLLSLPFILCSVGFFFRPLAKPFFFVSYYFVIIFYCVAFFICCADIPYFNHYSSHITSAALLWTSSPWFMLRMIFGTFIYWIYLVVFLLFFRWFIKGMSREKAKVMEQFSSETNLFSFKSILFLLLIAPFLFLGIRGRLAKKSPMLVGTAYFCDNNFLNQLGLNAVFTFMTSVLEDMQPGNHRVNLMPDDIAIKNVKEYLNSGKGFDSPVARKITVTGNERKMNVVVVIMEGMSMYNLGMSGERDTIAPFLDSLIKRSLWFGNCYTQGIHTFNGIYSSVYSYPSLVKRHPLADIPAKKYYSMPEVLKERGYQTAFFITHDGQFDNVQGFLTANGFDRVYAESDYPPEKILSTMGVPDDYLFEYSIPKMNAMAGTGKNFFCGFMTGSNHYPLMFPPWIKKKFTAPQDYTRILQYSDWAIGEFIRNASKQSWYNNTIFVFVADHGTNQVHTYDMPLSFHYSPLIIFAPGLNLTPASYDDPCGQMDIFPTVMGLMNLSYVNNTMGIDLLKEKRPCIYFTADDKIGCIDREYYFIHRKDGTETLYRYDKLSTENFLERYKARADSLRSYAFSMLQTAQWVVEREKFAKK